MARRNAVAVEFGIVVQKRAHESFTKQFVGIGKEGMH